MPVSGIFLIAGEQRGSGDGYEGECGDTAYGTRRRGGYKMFGDNVHKSGVRTRGEVLLRET